MPRKKNINDFLSMEPHEWDLDHLKHALQNAIELEHSTLPLYLFAMYSIRTQNYTAYNLMRSIVMEEMIHMGLAANMLAAIGGAPKIRGLHPGYPSQGLPGGAEPDVHARMSPLSKIQIRNFMRVEVPDFLLSNFLSADQMTHEEFPTIGRFYEGIKEAFLHLEGEGGQVTEAISQASGPGRKKHPMPLLLILSLTYMGNCLMSSGIALQQVPFEGDLNSIPSLFNLMHRSSAIVANACLSLLLNLLWVVHISSSPFGITFKYGAFIDTVLITSEQP